MKGARFGLKVIQIILSFLSTCMFLCLFVELIPGDKISKASRELGALIQASLDLVKFLQKLDFIKTLVDEVFVCYSKDQ